MGQFFVTDTLMLDIRDGNTLYQPGDPIPREAINEGTLKTLYGRYEILEYSEVNKFRLNPKLIVREQVATLAGLAGQKVSEPPPVPNSMNDLVRMEQGLPPEPKKEEGPTKLVVTVPDPNTMSTKNALAGKVWDFKPETISQLDFPVLLSMMTERAQHFEKRVPDATEFPTTQDLIKFMSSEFVLSKSETMSPLMVETVSPPEAEVSVSEVVIPTPQIPV